MRPKFNQINIVSANPAASVEFYRKLGVDIPEPRIWGTDSAIHHVSAIMTSKGDCAVLDIDSMAFARLWNSGWSGREDLKGRVVVGFNVPTREAVDELYAEMTGAGYGGLQAPYDAFFGARYAVLEDPDGIAVGLMSPKSPDRKSPPPQV